MKIEKSSVNLSDTHRRFLHPTLKLIVLFVASVSINPCNLLLYLRAMIKYFVFISPLVVSILTASLNNQLEQISPVNLKLQIISFVTRHIPRGASIKYKLNQFILIIRLRDWYTRWFYNFINEDFNFSKWLLFDAYYVLGLLHNVVVGDVADLKNGGRTHLRNVGNIAHNHNA
jgi:hypothetical protein